MYIYIYTFFFKVIVNDFEKSNNFFIVNATPMRQYLKRTVFK